MEVEGVKKEICGGERDFLCQRQKVHHKKKNRNLLLLQDGRRFFPLQTPRSKQGKVAVLIVCTLKVILVVIVVVIQYTLE